jgi:hypothetical protein
MYGLPGFPLASLSSLVEYLEVRPEPTEELHFRAGYWSFPKIIRPGLKALSGKNTLAYCDSLSVMKKKSFITFTYGDNLKNFFFIIEE